MKTLSCYSITFILLFVGCSTEKKIESIEDINNSAPGIWVGNTGDVFGSVVFWLKYVIKTDGTYLQYYTMASSDNWGEPLEYGTWTARTNKYSDSGERYFYVEINDNPSMKRFQGRGLEAAILKSSTKMQWRGQPGSGLKLWSRSVRLTGTTFHWGGPSVSIDFEKGDKFPFAK